MKQDDPASLTATKIAGDADFAALDDSTLLSMRAQMREELERLPVASPRHAVLAARYDRSTQEVNDRARRAWARTQDGAVSNTANGILVLPDRAAMLLAVDVLLADPEALGNDALEGDLYVLRDQLQAAKEP